MPRVKEYTAPEKAFSEDAAGFAAFETAGRRIAPLLDRGATGLREAGQAGVRGAAAARGVAEGAERLATAQERQASENERVVRDTGRQREANLSWPFDIARLEDQGSGSSRGGRGGGGGMRLAGSVNPEINNRDAGTTDDRPSRDRSYSPGRGSAIAAGLGALASNRAGNAPYAARQDINPNAAGSGLVYDSRYPGRYGGQESTLTLENGRLVRGDNRGASMDPNKDAQQQANDYGNSIAGQGMDTSSGLPRDYGQIGTEIANDIIGRGGNAVTDTFSPQAQPTASTSSWEMPWDALTPGEYAAANSIISGIGSLFGGSSSGGNQGGGDNAYADYPTD